MDNVLVQNIMRGYYEYLSDPKLENLGEMDRLWVSWNFPELKEKEVKILNK